MSPSWRANPDRDTVLRLTPVSRPVWEEFLARCDSALPYHTWDWQDFLCEVYKGEWVPLGIWAGEACVGLFPVMLRQLGPFRLAGSPLMQVIASTPFVGPLTASEWVPEIFLALERFLKARQIAYFEITIPPPILSRELDGVRRRGYSVETCEAVFLSLRGQTSEKLWGQVNNACRRAIRKAQASGVKIIAPNSSDFLPMYAAMCQEVYQESGRLPHLSERFYQTLWARFGNGKMVHWLLATYKGQIVAGAVFLVYGDYACYLSGASFNEWQPLRPNNLLQWHFIEGAAAHGIARYDLGGAAMPGITRFKLSFGAHLVPYTRLYRANTPLAHLGRRAYQFAIPHWRRLQTFLSSHTIR